MGTDCKLATNGSTSYIDVSGIEIMGLPVMGSTSSKYFSTPVHSPFTKFIPLSFVLRFAGSRVAKCFRCWEAYLAYKGIKDMFLFETFGTCRIIFVSILKIQNKDIVFEMSHPI